jgi:peptidoglycan/LPS O-acetylase OafA/YrhL
MASEHTMPVEGTRAAGKVLALEGLRGVAATLVLVNHLPIAPSLAASPDPSGFTISGPMLVTAGNCGSLGVEIFFCLTGYLFWKRTALSERPVDWTRFYVNRFLRIAPAFFVAAAMVLLYAGFASHWSIATGGRQLFREIFGALSFGFINPQSINGVNVNALNAVNWTLPYEWQFYALVPMLAAIRRAPRPLTAAAAGAFLLFIFGSSIYLYLWLFFLTGILAAEFNRTGGHRGGIASSLAGALLIVAYVAVRYDNVSARVYALTGIETIADAAPVLIRWALVSALFMIVVELGPKMFRAAAVVWVGTVSYSLYLLHLTVLQVTLSVARRWYPIGQWSAKTFLTWGILAVALSFVIAALSYQFIEAPFLKKKRNERSPSESTASADHWPESNLETINTHAQK